MIFLVGKDLKINRLSCLYFYAEWSLYHDKCLKMIESFENKCSDIEFMCINVDLYPEYVKQFNIKEIPSFVFLDDGKELSRFSGMVLTKPFHSYCKKVKDKNDKRRSKKSQT